MLEINSKDTFSEEDVGYSRNTDPQSPNFSLGRQIQRDGGDSPSA